MQIEEFEEQFISFHTKLVDECIKLNAYIKILKRIEERKRDRLEQINIAPVFFQITCASLFTSIVLWVSNIFDDRSQRGIHKFLSFVQPHLRYLSINELKRRKGYQDGHWMLEREELTNTDIEEDFAKLKQLDVIEKFKLHRDKYHAHFDKEYFFKQGALNEEAPITWAEIEPLPRVALDILNKYSAYYDGSLNTADYIGIHDIDSILDNLHRFDKLRRKRSNRR
jgi:hypothetical protein